MDSTKQPRTDLAPLKAWERRGLLAFLAVLVIFGVIVEIRSAFQSSRRTDLGIYLRAAWAARTGENPYTITDDNGWHFCYPPVVAMLLTPLADAPAGHERTLLMPWALTVMLWYLLNVACLFLAVHWIAGTLEARSNDPAVRTMPAGCRRWWYDRMFPVLVCLVQIGSTLSRGQVSILLILCVAGIFTTLMNGQRLRSGLWLSAAICLKIIPAFLLLFPLWRRDGRALLGAALGLSAGLVVMPALYWGGPEAFNLSRQVVDGVLHPGLAEGGDQTRAKELTDITGTDNQSFLAILHNYQHWGRLDSRPAQPEAWVRTAHWLISAVLTLAVLVAVGWRRDDDPIRCLLFLASLFLLMTLVTPMSHLHYFAMALPLVMALGAVSLHTCPGMLLPRPAMLGVLLCAGAGYALPTIPFWTGRREAGLPMIVSVILLAVTMGYLWTQRRRAQTLADATELRRAA